MIRAWIGRFALHCIERHKRRRFRMETRKLELATMSDRQISDLVHGRPITPDREPLLQPRAMR